MCMRWTRCPSRADANRTANARPSATDRNDLRARRLVEWRVLPVAVPVGRHETGCRHARLQFGVRDETQPARIRQQRIVAAEAVVRVERHDRAVDRPRRVMEIDDAEFVRLDAACRLRGCPCSPRFGARVAGIEQEAAAVVEHASHAAQCRVDVVVGQQALERVPGHHHSIERRTGRQAVERAREPAYGVGTRLASRVIDHRRRGIDRDDVMPGRREPPRERAGAATEIEDASPGGADRGGVEREVPIARVEQVVHRDEARVGVEQVRVGARHAAACVSAAARLPAARAR